MLPAPKNRDFGLVTGAHQLTHHLADLLVRSGAHIDLWKPDLLPSLVVPIFLVITRAFLGSPVCAFQTTGEGWVYVDESKKAAGALPSLLALFAIEHLPLDRLLVRFEVTIIIICVMSFSLRSLTVQEQMKTSLRARKSREKKGTGKEIADKNELFCPSVGAAGFCSGGLTVASFVLAKSKNEKKEGTN